jgi:DNA-3-methyladenine glycosylase I
MHLPCVGLLVDKGNPDGEALYSSVGFKYMNDSRWGGHEMKHLIWLDAAAIELLSTEVV